nr:hypothetical protein [Tanacetum cinerariifolium]
MKHDVLHRSESKLCRKERVNDLTTPPAEAANGSDAAVAATDEDSGNRNSDPNPRDFYEHTSWIPQRKLSRYNLRIITGGEPGHQTL